MAGTDSRFNSTAFRDAIHFAMTMGQSSATQDFITWSWLPKRTFIDHDPGGAPLVWTDTAATDDSPSPVVIKCAYEFTPSGLSATRVGGTGMGVFDTGNLVVTVLDADYPTLFDSQGRFVDQAKIDNSYYNVKYTAPPVGLFDVTVYTIYLQAVDET